MTEPMQFVDEKPDAPYEIRIYRGADGSFTLYEDGGDGYEYEQRAFALMTFSWNETSGELSIGARRGNFRGLITCRKYHLIFVSSLGRKTKTIDYTGEETVIAV